MNDKPKRKRSEKQKPLWRLRSLMLLHALFLVPYLFDSLSFQFLLIGFVSVLGVLGIGGFFMKLIGQLKENFPTKLVFSLIGAASTTLVSLLFTASALLGLFLWADFSSRQIPLLHTPILFPLIMLVSLASPIICFLLALELQIQIMELINPVLNDAIEDEKQKNDDSSSLSDELEESEIPLELLAESESAEQAQR